MLNRGDCQSAILNSACVYVKRPSLPSYLLRFFKMAAPATTTTATAATATACGVIDLFLLPLMCLDYRREMFLFCSRHVNER